VNARDFLPRFAPDALASLVPLIERPLGRRRFRLLAAAVASELERRAAAHGTTPEAELTLAAAAGLAIAKSEGQKLAPRPWAEWRRWYRGRVERHVTEDLLGPGWRRTPPVPVEAASDPAEAIAGRLDAQADARALYDVATVAEREVLLVLSELLAAGKSVQTARREAARRTGRSLNALRQLLHRLRRRNASARSAELGKEITRTGGS